MGKEKRETPMFSDDDLGLFEEVTSHLEDEENDEIIETPESTVIESLEDDEKTEETETEEAEEEATDDDSSNESEDIEEENDGEDPSLFVPYFNLLVEDGVLANTKAEDFDGTADGLKKAMSNEIRYHVEQYKSQMPQEIKRLLDGYEQGVPFDEMLKVTSDAIRYDNIKEESLTDNIEIQKGLVKDYLNQTTRLSDKMKDKMISQFEDGMELEEQAKAALNELKGIQAQKEKDLIEHQKNERIAYENRQKETISKLEKHISETEEIIPGIKINQVIKDNIKKNLTVPVEYDQFGNPINKLGKYMMENPIEGEFMLNYMFEATDGFKDWGVFSKAGKSRAILELEKATKKLDNGANKGTLSKSKKRKSNDTLEGIAGFLKG